MKQILSVGIIAVAAAFSASPSLASESSYTDLDLDRCQTIAGDDLGATMSCPGLGDYPVYFKEGDLRQSVLFGKVDPRLVEGAFESFSAFNRVNTKIEWRHEGSGRPHAAILRWFIENPSADGGAPTKASTGQVLVVSKVAVDGHGSSCFVAMVDALANSDANLLARQAADEQAADFACGTQEPRWIGKRGEKSGERAYSWPEGYTAD